MNKSLSVLIVLSIALGIALPAVGADTMLLDEIIFKGEKEAPNQETLTIREVRESPAKDIGEALEQMEGIDIVRKGAIANDVVLRGFQRDNINVLVERGDKKYVHTGRFQDEEQARNVDRGLRATLIHEGFPFTALQPDVASINAFAQTLLE